MSQTVKAQSGKSLSVILKEDTKTLDEIVVVGFGTQKKVNLTGSVSTVNAEDLLSRPVSNVSQALQGLVPGMNFSYASDGNGGEIGADMKVNIRGAGTIGDGSNASPLILIDGMEGNMNMLNPNDIESISVLKDAAASSIYGSRAPFGVVLITTKTVSYTHLKQTWITFLHQQNQTISQRFKPISYIGFKRTSALRIMIVNNGYSQIGMMFNQSIF